MSDITEDIAKQNIDLEKVVQKIENIESNEELLYQLSGSNIIMTRNDSKT